LKSLNLLVFLSILMRRALTYHKCGEKIDFAVLKRLLWYSRIGEREITRTTEPLEGKTYRSDCRIGAIRGTFLPSSSGRVESPSGLGQTN